LKREMIVARNGGRAAAVAVNHGRAPKATARLARNSSASSRPQASVAVEPTLAFHERSLMHERLAAAFRIDAGGGWATGTLPEGAGENEIAKFLGEAMSLAKQMQAAMGGMDTAAVQILIADPQAGAPGQSAIKVSLESSGRTAVTLQTGGGGHLVSMLQHFLMALNPAGVS
jgi:hypothetical protein